MQLQELLSDPLVRRLGLVAGIVFLILLASYFIKKGLNKTLKDTDNKYRARKAVNFLAYLLLVVVLLIVFSDKLGNIGVAMGVAGAGIAFALQEVIVSFAGWLSIILTGRVSVGQRLKIGEIRGDVIDIGVLSTTIMEVGDWVKGDLYNGAIISVANSFVFKEKVHNYSAEYPFLWDEITVPIRIESDYKLAKQVFSSVLQEICGDYAAQSQEEWTKLSNKYRVEEAQVQPMVTLVFDQNWITFSLRYIVDYKKRRSTKDAIYTRLLAEISNHHPAIRIAASAMEVTAIKH